MSTDPTGLNNETCIQAINRKYICVGLNRKDWCGYKGDCKIENVINNINLCFICKYLVPLDIPEILNKED